AMAQYLNASLAQIFTFDARKRGFEPRAAAGISFDKREPGWQLPKLRLELGSLMEGQPVLIKQLLNDPRMPDQDWVKREGVVSYAAYPLMLEDKLVGLMSIFTPQALSEQINQEMSSVA